MEVLKVDGWHQEDRFFEVQLTHETYLDDEDIHNVASNIVANAFEEVISDVNNEKDSEANIIDEDYYPDYDDENQYAQQDDNISQEIGSMYYSVNYNKHCITWHLWISDNKAGDEIKAGLFFFINAYPDVKIGIQSETNSEATKKSF